MHKSKPVPWVAWPSLNINIRQLFQKPFPWIERVKGMINHVETWSQRKSSILLRHVSLRLCSETEAKASVSEQSLKNLYFEL